MTNEQTLEFLTTAANQHASDIFIIAGRPLSIKADGHLTDYGERLMPIIQNRFSNAFIRWQITATSITF